MFRNIILGIILGGFCWFQSAIFVCADTDPQRIPDKPSVTSDSQNAQNANSAAVDVGKIKEYISNLDADDITTRDKATEELRKMGTPALPYLIEASKSDIPEVAVRAKIIIRAIEREEQKKQSSQNEQSEDSNKQIGPLIRQFPNITIQNMNPGGKSFSYSRDSSGKVTVTITETDKDGKSNTKTLKADSIEEFRQKYPEIAKEYNLEESPAKDIPGINPEDIWKDFDDLWSLRFDDIQKRFDEMNKRFRDRFQNQSPWESKPENPDTLTPQQIPLSTTSLGIIIEVVEDSGVKRKLHIENGVAVIEVETGGLADTMGVKSGDIIAEVNSSSVGSIWECRRLVKSALESGKIALTIFRDGKRVYWLIPNNQNKINGVKYE